MPARLSLERQLVLGFLFPLLSLGVIALLTVVALRSSQQASREIVQTREVLQDVRALREAESRAVIAFQQGLLGGAAPQQAYARTRDTFLNRWVDLYARMDGDEEQRARLSEWRGQFERWDETVVRPALAALPASGPGPRLAPAAPDLDVLGDHDSLAAGFIEVEERQLDARRRASQRAVAVAFWAVTAGLPLLALLGWGLGWRLMRRVRDGTRALTAAATSVSEGDFSVRVRLDGGDELAELSRRFNAMAARLQDLMNRQLELQHTLEHRVDELVQDTTREVELLGRLANFVQASHDEAEAHDVIRRTAQELFAHGGEVALLAASRNLLEVPISWGVAEGSAAQVFGPEECWALRLGQAHAAQGSAPRCSHALQDRVSLCLPLMAHGDTMGVMTLYFAGEEVTDAARALAQRFSERVALSLANLRLRATLRQQSIRDGLTGLYNRRYLEETGARELSRAQRRGLPLSVLMIDVDHFKRFNDTHGHAVGDAVLRRVAVQMQRLFRADDVVCRFGGEEFVALLPDCDPECAHGRAEALRREVEDLLANAPDPEVGAVTVSVGVTSWEAGDPPHTFSDLLARADAALYQAKRSGRNQVVSTAARGGAHAAAEVG